jgi:hypothetical protein
VDPLEFARRYAYVLPEPHLLDVLRRHAPLVEVGAGTGWWAHRLRLAGVDIVAYDQAPPGGERENRYHPGAAAWADVLPGDARAAARHPDRALFLCWPPLYSSLWECVQWYAGGAVICVGDGGVRTARMDGLAGEFAVAERHPALAVDPAPGHPAEMVVWRRRSQV